MKINDPTINVDGTWYQGSVLRTSYPDLVSKLGPPDTADGYKVDAEWNIEDNDVVATIYSWKDGKNYLGEGGTPTDQITEWHVGGRSKDALKLVESIFPGKIEY